MRLLQKPPESPVQHGRAAPAAGALGDLLDGVAIRPGHLVGDEIDGAAAGIADDESFARLEDGRSEAFDCV